MNLKDIIDSVVKKVEEEFNRQEKDTREKLVFIKGSVEGVNYFLQMLDKELKEASAKVEQDGNEDNKPESPPAAE